MIVSAGGGAVGAPLLAAAMAARPLTALAGHVWRFLTGPNLGDDDFKALAKHASERTIVERFRDDFAARLRGATLSISQAGYNTTMDILSAGARAIVVPYEAKGETEQRLRAEILARKGLLTLLPAAELSPARVVQAVQDGDRKARRRHQRRHCRRDQDRADRRRTRRPPRSRQMTRAATNVTLRSLPG